MEVEGGEQGGLERARGPRLQQRLTNEQRLQAPSDLLRPRDSSRYRTPSACVFFVRTFLVHGMGCQELGARQRGGSCSPAVQLG